VGGLSKVGGRPAAKVEGLAPTSAPTTNANPAPMPQTLPLFPDDEAAEA
jgi:hypothetical protein